MLCKTHHTHPNPPPLPTHTQVSGVGLQRDHNMAAAELRVPPRVIRYFSDAESVVVCGLIMPIMHAPVNCV